MKKTFLDAQPARPLSSREIAKLLSTILGGLASNGWCKPDDIIDAIDHIAEYREQYLAILKSMRSQR